MQHKRLNETSGLRSYAVVLESGEEVMSCLGAFSDVVLMYFDWEKKDYLRIPVREQVEVAALIGDVAEDHQANPHCTSMSSWASVLARRLPDI